jgi:hypothetical protein
MGDWEFQGFSQVTTARDGRRAAFLLYDFIREFAITDFHVVGSTGEFNNQRIEIVYRIPEGRVSEQIELEWIDFIKDWKNKHD